MNVILTAYEGQDRLARPAKAAVTGETHPCPKCGKQYGYKSNLQRHLKMECGKPASFGCPYCELRCKHKQNLVVHLKRKHQHALAPLLLQ